VVDASACEKPLKMCAWFSGAMPIPLSRHGEFQQRCPSSPRSSWRTRNTTSPCAGELDGIATQIDQHLLQPHVIAQEHRVARQKLDIELQRHRTCHPRCWISK
jgi:hypothetical protein